jgi:adenylosuccinate synthase
MPAVVVVGAQWGDEGKGKIVDLLSSEASIVARFQGGNNAGHTLVVGGEKTVLHLVPSGVLHPETTCLIGPGVVRDPHVLGTEIDLLESRGLLSNPRRLRISPSARLIMPYHKALDGAREAAAGKGRIGTTKRGIGPAYEDVVNRRGIAVGLLTNLTALRQQLNRVLPEKNALLRYYNVDPLQPEEIVTELMKTTAQLGRHFDDTGRVISQALSAGRNVLFEGAQGALLDVLHGTVPFVTSSHTIAGAACTGSGVGPTDIDRVVGIAKGYVTRVGSGPLPTAIGGELEEQIRESGGEFGATTGRPRRCGWLDLAGLRYARRVNGLTELVLTKLDVLSGLTTIKVCTGYQLQNGERIDEMPTDPNVLEHATPLYREVPGWSEDLQDVRDESEIPPNAHAYLDMIEAEVGVPVTILSVGPGRAQTLVRQSPFA